MKQFLLPVWEILETLIIALVSILIIYTFMAQPFVVDGASMEPNFQDGNYLIVDEMTYRFREPQRGEVVVFYNPRNESEIYIKRIIGLPGEQVSVSGDEVKINGKILHESYMRIAGSVLGAKVFDLAPNEYFMMGDNRLNSSDSRIWGPLKRNDIIGTVRLRFWPPGKLDIFREAISYTFS